MLSITSGEKACLVNKVSLLISMIPQILFDKLKKAPCFPHFGIKNGNERPLFNRLMGERQGASPSPKQKGGIPLCKRPLYTKDASRSSRSFWR